MAEEKMTVPTTIISESHKPSDKKSIPLKITSIKLSKNTMKDLVDGTKDLSLAATNNTDALSASSTSIAETNNKTIKLVKVTPQGNVISSQQTGPVGKYVQLVVKNNTADSSATINGLKLIKVAPISLKNIQANVQRLMLNSAAKTEKSTSKDINATVKTTCTVETQTEFDCKSACTQTESPKMKDEQIQNGDYMPIIEAQMDTEGSSMFVRPFIRNNDVSIEDNILKENKNFVDEKIEHKNKIFSDICLGTGPVMPQVVSIQQDDSILKILDNNSSYCVLNDVTYDLPSREDIILPSNHKRNFEEKLNRCLCLDYNGNYPIHQAVLDDNITELARQIIVLKIKKESVDLLNKDDNTPLQLAVINCCQPNIYSTLIDFKADIYITDNIGNNLFHLAVETDNILFLQFFLPYYLDLTTTMRLDLINTANYEGLTPLIMCCICKGKHQLAELLLRFNADCNRQDPKSGKTPLYHAMENNNMEMVEMLLKYHANTMIKSFNGYSAHEAIFEMENVDQSIKKLVYGKDLPRNHLSASKRKSKYDKMKDTNGSLKIVSTMIKVELTEPGPSKRKRKSQH